MWSARLCIHKLDVMENVGRQALYKWQCAGHYRHNHHAVCDRGHVNGNTDGCHPSPCVHCGWPAPCSLAMVRRPLTLCNNAVVGQLACEPIRRPQLAACPAASNLICDVPSRSPHLGLLLKSIVPLDIGRLV